MLDGFARHGLFDLTVQVSGDLEVDCHHTIEDTGIVLGQAIREAVGDKAGIRRYGHMILPMDETLALCAVDLSGRPYLGFEAEFPTERVGGDGHGDGPGIFLRSLLQRYDEPSSARSWTGRTAIIWRRPCLRVLEKLWIWPRWKNPGSRTPGQRKEAYRYEL